MNNSQSKSIAPVTPPRCEACEGTGYYRYAVEQDHPYWGKIFPCPVCNQETIDSLCGLKANERFITLDSIRTANRPKTKLMVDAALNFIERPRGFLSFHGTNGNGKTLALMAIVNAMLKQGINARYLTASKLLAYMRDTFKKDSSETDYDRLDELASLPVLCIDELEKLRDSDYSREIQQELINERYRGAGVLGTVLVWNGGLEAVPWASVTSRLSEFPVIENTDSDMRREIGAMFRKFIGGAK